MDQEQNRELQLWLEWDRREKQQKLERFRRLNRYVRKGQIVFAGSSLMEQFPAELDCIQLSAVDTGVPKIIIESCVQFFFFCHNVSLTLFIL